MTNAKFQIGQRVIVLTDIGTYEAATVVGVPNALPSEQQQVRVQFDDRTISIWAAVRVHTDPRLTVVR